MATAVRTNRGGFKVFDDTLYHYRLDYTRKDNQYYKCVEAGCGARLTTAIVENEGAVEIKRKVGEHPHAAKPLESTVIKAKRDMRNSSKITGRSSRAVVSSTLTDVNNDVKAILPTNESLSRSTRRLVGSRC